MQVTFLESTDRFGHIIRVDQEPDLDKYTVLVRNTVLVRIGFISDAVRWKIVGKNLSRYSAIMLHNSMVMDNLIHKK